MPTTSPSKNGSTDATDAAASTTNEASLQGGVGGTATPTTTTSTTTRNGGDGPPHDGVGGAAEKIPSFAEGKADVVAALVMEAVAVALAEKAPVACVPEEVNKLRRNNVNHLNEVEVEAMEAGAQIEFLLEEAKELRVPDLTLVKDSIETVLMMARAEIADINTGLEKLRDHNRCFTAQTADPQETPERVRDMGRRLKEALRLRESNKTLQVPNESLVKTIEDEVRKTVQEYYKKLLDTGAYSSKKLLDAEERISKMIEELAMDVKAQITFLKEQNVKVWDCIEVLRLLSEMADGRYT